MLSFLFSRISGDYYPRFLYQLAADMFALVRHWRPEEFGCARGREYEELFYRYCDHRKLSITERAGSRTFRGFRSSSGFSHENDGVIAGPDSSVHLELKYLAGGVQKNDLLVFNQKGIDYLLGMTPAMRQKPLYRMLLSGSGFSDEARVFALQWGIILVDPDSLPMLMIHQLSGRHVPSLIGVDVERQNEIWRSIPRYLTPLQQRLQHVSSCIAGGATNTDEDTCRRFIESVQRGIGDCYWTALDELSPSWIEDHYVALANRLMIRCVRHQNASSSR